MYSLCNIHKCVCVFKVLLDKTKTFKKQEIFLTFSKFLINRKGVNFLFMLLSQYETNISV